MSRRFARRRGRGMVGRQDAHGLTVALLCCTLTLAARDGWAGDVEPGVSGTVSIEEGYTDNVRWDKNLRDGAWYTTFEGEGTWQRKPRGWLPHRLGGLMRARVYSGYGNRDYAEVGPTIGYDWKLVSLTIDYRYSPNHLRVDPATTIGAFADVHNLSSELRSKFGKNKRWTALLKVDFDSEFYDPGFRDRNFFQETVEAGLRCRATPMITPRASVAFSTRDAISSNFDREDVGLLFGFDLNLPAGIRGMFRFEKTWRNFLVGYPQDSAGQKNNNYHREDDAYNLESGLDFPVPWTSATTVKLRYRHRDNESSRPDRNFYVNEASLRLSYEF